MIPKKLVKLSKDMRVDTITKQNKRDFAPLCFGDVPKLKANPNSKKKKHRPKENPKQSTRPARGKEARRNRREKKKQESTEQVEQQLRDAKKTPSKKQDVHHYNPLMTTLCSLLEREEHDKRQCNNDRLFKIYNRRVLGRVEKVCNELSQLDGLESELGWVQKTLLPFLNNFAIYYSHICKERHKTEDYSYAKELEHWLYEEVSNECAQLNWFSLQKVYPYRDQFIDGAHKQKRVVSIHENLHDKILEIRSLGLMEVYGDEVVEPAQVVVGIHVQKS